MVGVIEAFSGSIGIYIHMLNLFRKLPNFSKEKGLLQKHFKRYISFTDAIYYLMLTACRLSHSSFDEN